VFGTVGGHSLAFGSVDNVGNRSATQTASFTISPGGVTEHVFAGEDRYETAVLASRSQFATGTVGTVIIATGENFPDALSAGPLAGAYGSPVLLTRYNGLPTVVAEEIARLGATHAIIIGGTGVVLPQVQTEIESIVTSHTVSRLSGSDRYGTAAVVANAVKAKVGAAWDGTVYVATGTNFPDALSAGPNAYHKTRPILLVKGATIPAATANAVASLLPVQGAILGGVGVIPSSTVDALFTHGQDIVRLGGANRYETAVDVAAWSAATEGQSWSVLGIATGQSFADALSGGAVIGKQGGVMLLTMPTSLPEPTATTIAEQVDDIQTVEFFGGDGAVSPAVRAQIMGLLP
jgi:putative cell wall-binding protein